LGANPGKGKVDGLGKTVTTTGGTRA
jgi:hypothetical protein